MKNITALLVLSLSFCLAAVARAQIKASHFPQDAQWVLHMDLKALNEAPMGQFLQHAMDDQMRRGLSSLTAKSGINLTNDVDSLVVCGKGNAGAGGVMYAYGRFNIPKLTAIVGGSTDFESQTCGAHKVLSWSDKGKRTNLCFINPTLAVMSQDEQLVQEAITLIDGKAKGLSPDQSFAKMLMHRKGRFLSIQANNLAALAGANPQFQLFSQAEALQLEIGQLNGANGLDCALALKAPNKEMAQQLNQAALGLQALAMLQAAKNPDTAEIAQNLKICMQDTVVTVNLQISEALLKKMAQNRQMQQKNGAASGTGNAAKRPAQATF